MRITTLFFPNIEHWVRLTGKNLKEDLVTSGYYLSWNSLDASNCSYFFGKEKW